MMSFGKIASSGFLASEDCDAFYLSREAKVRVNAERPYETDSLGKTQLKNAVDPKALSQAKHLKNHALLNASIKYTEAFKDPDEVLYRETPFGVPTLLGRIADGVATR